jgi:DNA-binding CsgD family transcriptional regulator
MSLDTSALAVIETLYEFLDRRPAAIVLLDGQKRVVFANQQAGELHARADGITICGNGIGLLRGHDDARLQGLIARAIGQSSPGDTRQARRCAGGSMRATRLSGGRPYGVLVASVTPRDGDREVGHGTIRPVVCIVIADPDHVSTLPIERLRDAFGLTEAEARLAGPLAAGQGLRAAAQSLGITYGTARARLAEIFQKTQTSRQGELVNLLLTTLGAV